MKKTEQLFELIHKNNFITVADAISLNISRSYLYKLVEDGVLEKVSKGLFTLPSIDINKFDSILEVQKRVPKGVVSLLSALSIHELTTQAPHEVWITIPYGNWKTQINYPPVHYTTTKPKTYAFGIESYKIGSTSIRVYSVAKTVADCFKFRNQVGLDVAIEALRETWQNKRATMDEITKAAKICRVLNIMKPYLESIV